MNIIKRAVQFTLVDIIRMSKKASVDKSYRSRVVSDRGDYEREIATGRSRPFSWVSVAEPTSPDILYEVVHRINKSIAKEVYGNHLFVKFYLKIF